MTHTEHEDFAWTISVGDHAARADSPVYRRSRKLMIKVLGTFPAEAPWFYGCGLQRTGSPNETPEPG